MNQRPSPLLDQYTRGYFEVTDTFVESPQASPTGAEQERQRHYLLNPHLGSGWTDMNQFGSGILVGRMAWRLARTVADDYVELPRSVCLGFMISGVATLSEPAGRTRDVTAGHVLVRNNPPTRARRRALPGAVQSGISIDLPDLMLQTLQDQGVDLGCIARPGTFEIFKGSAHLAAALSRIGQRMLAIDVNQSLLARIELESVALDFLLKLLEAGAQAPDQLPGRYASRWQVALDDAMDIIHAEWREPLTIALLARRAGINECYLKTMFRERTGQGIAGYLRDLRMRKALDLLESDHYSVQQVAELCGYTHSGKFAQAFRRYHGTAPSRLS